MFSNIFNNVVEKLSGLNPIKTFIKYALDKFLNELINNQITLEDFKNGCLNLTGIGFNVANVNLKHLISSPYIMHSGSIGNLRIQLPNLSQIVTKSIQIYVNQITIELKPNKDFYKNFKQRMKDLQQNMVFDDEESLPEEQLSENNPMDFFKETLKKILLNIRVRVENVNVKVYMNDPEVQRDGDVHYLMVRVPLLNVHKNNDHKKGNLNVEEIKLDIEIPQISVHIVKQQNASKRKSHPPPSSTFKNQPPTTSTIQQPNPSSATPINSPTTIILFGLADYKGLAIQTDKSIPRVTLSVVTNNKQQRRDIKLSITGTRFQMMVDPMQLRVVDRFIRQVREFRDIFTYVKKQLNLGQYPHHHQHTPINKRSTSPSSSSSSISSSRMFQSRSDDIFSSICMSILQPEQSLSCKSKRPPGLIESMIKQTPDLQRSVSQFNQQFRRQLREKNLMEKVSQEMSTELRVNSFKKQVDVSIEVKSVVVYVLKEIPKVIYTRKWSGSLSTSTPTISTTNSSQPSSFPINHHIPCPYFMLSAYNISLQIKQDNKLILLQLSSLKLNDIKLVLNKTHLKQSQMMSFISHRSDEFVDVQSSGEFYKSQEEVMCERVAGEMGEFVLGQGEHYCCTEIVRISRNPSQTTTSNTCCFYNFMPKPQDPNQSYNSLLYKPSLFLSINKHKQLPIIQLQIIQLAINGNLQILKQVHDILHQVYFNTHINSNSIFGVSNDSMFGDIRSDIKSISKDIDNTSHNMWRKKTMLQSRYNFGVDQVMIDHPIQQHPKPVIQIKLHQVNIAFYQSTPQLQCFCNSNKHGLYLQIFSPKIQLKNDVLHVTMRKLVTGSIRVKNSHVSKIKAFLNISSTVKKQASTSLFTFILQKLSHQQMNKLYLIIPQCSFSIDEKDILETMLMVGQQMKVLNNIIEHFRQLKRMMQEQEIGSPLKKRQRKAYPMQYQSQLQIYMPHVQVRVMNIKALIKDIYIRKSAQTLTVKLNTLVIGLQQKLQLFLNQMRNQQLCLREHIEKTSKYDGFIRDSSIVVELGDNSNSVNNIGLNSNGSNNNSNSNNNNNNINKFQFKSRNPYFDTIATAISTLSITISKSSSYQQSSFGNNNTSSTTKPKQMLASKDKFKFTKKPSHRQSMESFCGSRSVILQQEQQKRIVVNITQPVYVMGNAVLRLVEHKDTLLQLVKKLVPIIQSIKQLPFTSPERKNSTDSEIDKLQSLTISLSPGKLFLDIRPTFVQQLMRSSQKNLMNIQQHEQQELKELTNNNKVKSREIIFSSSRSFMQLGWEVFEVEIDKRVKSVKCKASCGLRYYFLQHEDREIGTNPILIRQHDLDRLGFICLLELSALKLQLTSLPKSKTINLSINMLSFTSSLSTLGYLQLHWQHFINHNLHRNFGLTIKQEQDRFQVIEQPEGSSNSRKGNNINKGRSKQNSGGNNSDSSDEWVKLEQQYLLINQSEQQQDTNIIEDLTQGLQHYRKKTQFKHQLKTYFQQKPFTQPKSTTQTQLYLQQLLIKQMKIKIYSGNDFEFITFQSINQSDEQKRNRINDSEMLKYLQVRVDSLEVVAKASSIQRQIVEALVKVENLQVNYSSKREMKNGWLGQKRMEQVVFPVLRSLNSIKVLIQSGHDRLCVKLNKTPFDIGFTSEILQLVEQFKLVKSRIAMSGWKKVYQKSKLQKKSSKTQQQKPLKFQQMQMPKLLLLQIPQNRLNIRLVYKKITILSDQCVISSQFLLNQQLANHEKIQIFVKSWVKNLVLDNIGGLIGGTAINILSDVIMEMLGLGYFLVGLVMGN